MKVRLFIVHPTLHSSGAERVTVILLQKLDWRDFELSLILVRQEGHLLAEVPDDITITELGSRSLWTCVLALAKSLRWQRPDIVFSPGGTNVPLITTKLVARVPTKVIVSERNSLAHTVNVVAWEQALRRLIAERELRQRLGRNAWQDLLNHYTWEARAKKVLRGL